MDVGEDARRFALNLLHLLSGARRNRLRPKETHSKRKVLRWVLRAHALEIARLLQSVDQNAMKFSAI